MIIRVNGQEQLNAALALWRAGPEGEMPENQPQSAVIEITKSGVFVLPINIKLAEDHSLQIRAASGKRPLIRLLDWQTDMPDNLFVTGGKGSRFTLDGVLIAGRGVQVEGQLASVTIRHSTLVPGWSLEPDCDPSRPSEPSLEIINAYPCIVIEHSIIGSIQVNLDEVKRDPIPVRISDSIVDATGADCDSPQCEAVGAAGSALAHATVNIVRSTVIGRVLTHAIRLAENSIFMGRITVARRQLGCIRFCYVTPGSRTPSRYNCQPDLAERNIKEEMLKETPRPEDEVIAAAQKSESDRARPLFNSMRYGTPAYCQLSQACAEEIVRGADDASEMGVFHDLYQPQREANLRVRLDEYVPAHADVGIILVN